jgi:hypothetical protein
MVYITHRNQRISRHYGKGIGSFFKTVGSIATTGLKKGISMAPKIIEGAKMIAPVVASEVGKAIQNGQAASKEAAEAQILKTTDHVSSNIINRAKQEADAMKKQTMFDAKEKVKNARRMAENLTQPIKASVEGSGLERRKKDNLSSLLMVDEDLPRRARGRPSKKGSGLYF